MNLLKCSEDPRGRTWFFQIFLPYSFRLIGAQTKQSLIHPWWVKIGLILVASISSHTTVACNITDRCNYSLIITAAGSVKSARDIFALQLHCCCVLYSVIVTVRKLWEKICKRVTFALQPCCWYYCIKKNGYTYSQKHQSIMRAHGYLNNIFFFFFK